MGARGFHGDRRAVRAAVAALAAAALWLALSCAAWAAERVALVIGNSIYENVRRLENPGHDARAVGAAFERLGYAVTRLEDAGFDALRRGLLDFTRAASASEVAVVFYAGHGIEVDGHNFLVPVDAVLARDADVEYEAAPLSLVTRAVGGARRLGLVVLDACRDNPFVAKLAKAGATRSIGRGLAKVKPAGGTLVAYAAEEGETADDDAGTGHSPYTEALLRYLEEPGLEVGRLFRKVRAEVERTTGGRQTPVEYARLPEADIYLASASPPPPPTPKAGGTPPPQPIQSSGAAARAAYEAAKEIGTVDAYRIVVEDFPGTTYAKLAQTWIDKHEKPNPVVAPGGEDDTPPLARDPAEVEKGLELRREERRMVQMALASAGHDPGPADGKLGERSREALRAWQGSKELAETGYLTREQSEGLVALGREEAEARRRAEAEREAREAEERRKRARSPGTRFRDCPECPKMVVVPSGSFMMGSPNSEEGREDDEGPVHGVRIAEPFAVGVYEVTRGEYARFVSATGHVSRKPCATYEDGKWGERSGRDWNNPGFRQTDEHPVVCVDWDDAKAYVAWLSGKTGEEYRLLSESEWEYAARAGTRTRYWRGDSIGRNRANCNGCGSHWDGRQTAPVGSFSANAFGLHDVHGNVSESVEDCWNDGYRGAPRDGSAWESEGCGERVFRGGSWAIEPRYLRSANRRHWYFPGARNNEAGFRVARTLAP